MSKKKKIWLLVGIVLVALAGIYLIGLGTGMVKPQEDSSSATTESAANSSVIENSISSTGDEPTTEPYSGTFTAGHYTAGIDFPAGNYDLTAVSGTGNVSSDNLFSGGLNEIMGLSDNDIYQPSFHGAVLETGVVLSISGDLQLQLDCSAAMTGTMQARQNTATQEYTFSSGNYVCGTDFEPGTYVLTAVSGDGNVSSDNLYSGGLNEIMGVQNDSMYIATFQNAMFESGDTLSISGVTIQLTPSK